MAPSLLHDDDRRLPADAARGDQQPLGGELRRRGRGHRCGGGGRPPHRPGRRSTFTESVLTDVGGFGAPFALDTSRYAQPVLVSSTDGVGTKLLVAEATGRYDTIGIDLVAMVVDDLVCQGAEPLFLLDYLAVGALDPDVVETVVNGIADGCRQARGA